MNVTIAKEKERKEREVLRGCVLLLLTFRS
jgi:hypothetical protein